MTWLVQEGMVMWQSQSCDNSHVTYVLISSTSLLFLAGREKCSEEKYMYMKVTSLFWTNSDKNAGNKVFSHKSSFEIAMTNCNCNIWITKCTREREKTSPCLRFSIPEQGWSVARFCVLLTCWLLFHFNIRKRTVYRRKWLEGHVALPPKSKFRGQGIHTAILLRDLRDAFTGKHLLTIIWIAQVKLR